MSVPTQLDPMQPLSLSLLLEVGLHELFTIGVLSEARSSSPGPDTHVISYYRHCQFWSSPTSVTLFDIDIITLTKWCKIGNYIMYPNHLKKNSSIFSLIGVLLGYHKYVYVKFYHFQFYGTSIITILL